MSKRFTLPNGPLGWQASPLDLAGAVADVPYMNVYTAELTQRFILGTRKLTWDGRVFKYSSSGSALCSGQGAQNTTAPFILDDGTVHPAATTAVGDTSLTIAGRTVAKDALAGGYIIIYTGTGNDKTQFRAIVGNTVGAATTIIVDLEAPLTEIATKDSTDICAYYSPYYALTNVPGIGDVRASTMGVPACYVSASGKFFWLQTWGPCRITPGEAGYGNADEERQLVFDFAGSVYSHSVGSATTLQRQHAGFIIPKTAVDDAPLLMLQISI